MGTSRRLIGALGALAVAVTTAVVGAASGAQAVGPDRLPLTVTNSSGRGDAVYLYVLGTNLSTGRLGYVNAGGTFTDWPAGAQAADARAGRRRSPAPATAAARPSRCRAALRPRLLLPRREAQVLPHPGRAGAARAVGRRRRQPRHPVRLERVHLQRRRAVAEQLAGRHVRGAARGDRHRRSGTPSGPATSSPTAATTVINGIAAQPGWASTVYTRARRHGAARARARQGGRARACSAPPTSTRTSPRRGARTRPRR